MRHVAWCLALGVIPALGQFRPARAAEIAVYTQFQNEPSQLVLDSLKGELTSIMSPMGMRLEWRSLAGARGNEISEELAVVTFQGKCDIADVMPKHIETRALGWTHVSDGEVLPFSEVDCDRIRAFVQPELIPLHAQDRAHAFGRAIGRVLAHELYHVFSKTRHHASVGLAKATFTMQELMADGFSFQEADVRTIEAQRPGNRSRAKADTSNKSGRALFASGCASCHGARGEGTHQGPALRTAGRSFDFRSLAARLRGKRSKMSLCSQVLGVPSSTLADDDIEDLLSFLNTSVE